MTISNYIKKQLPSFLIFSSIIFGAGIEDVEDYHKNSHLQWKAAISLMEGIEWTCSSRILDVGCGDGKITAFIAKELPEAIVVGTDISSEMIHFASHQHSQHKNLLFLRADAAHLSFEEQFDTVVSFSALHWVIDQEAALQGIYKALLPGGKVHILTYAKAPMNICALSENLIYSEKWNSYFPDYKPHRIHFTEEEYRNLLEKTGFTQLKLSQEWSQTIFSNRQVCKDFVSPLLDFAKHLSLELKEKFLDDLVDQISSLSEKNKNGTLIF